MADAIKKLPSGLWSTRVRLPNGRRVRVTHELRGRVAEMADDLRADVRRGDWVDPELSKRTIAEWWVRAQEVWDHSEATWNRKWHPTWRNHVEKKWSNTSVGTILKPDGTQWIKEMKEAGLSATTIEPAIGLVRALLELAVDSRALRSNPFEKVFAPKRKVSVHRVITWEEEAAIVATVKLLYPGRLDALPFIDALADTGGRWQDAAGILKRDIDRETGMTHLTGVLLRNGTRKETLKTEGGEVSGGRHVVLMPSTIEQIKKRLDAIGPETLVYLTPEGCPLDYHRWLRMVWQRTLKATRLCFGRLENCDVRPAPVRKHAKVGPPYCQNWAHGIPEPWPTPHDWRHTLGTRLARANVPRHEIQASLGHKDPRSTDVYIHASDERFDHVRDVRSTARGA